MTASLVRVAATRTGVKGPHAAAWLAARGLPVPAQPNTWAALDGGGLIGRLGHTEFFIEGDAAMALERAAHDAPEGVYPVLRRDTALVLAGPDALDVLAQTCNLHFGALDLDARPLVMTLVIGVAVLVVPERRAGGVAYRIWCDPTFGPYLERTLHTIAAEAGEGALPAAPAAIPITGRGDP